MKFKSVPKDRTFFFNILNTLEHRIVDKFVYNSIKLRETKPSIPNEITIVPELRDIFTDEYSLIGNKGRMINVFRNKHKPHPKKYN